MNDDDFRQRDDIEDRTDDGPIREGVRGAIEGVQNRASYLASKDNADYLSIPEAPASKLGDDAGMKDLPKPKDYAEGGAIQTDQQALYGAPLGDDTGGAVNPMMDTQRGGTASGNANPRMSFAAGGAIPTDDDGDSDGDSDVDASGSDQTTQDFSEALKAVNAGLMYGRQKHGLPTGQSQDAGQSNGGSPSDTNNDSDNAVASFAEGGAIPANDDTDNEGAIDSGDNATGPSDNSGAVPVAAIPDDNSGAAPVADTAQAGSQDGQPQQQQQRHFGPLAYLMGIDGAKPEEVDNYKQGELGSESDRNLAAVKNAYDEKGPEGSFSIVQALRRKFDLFMNHGRSAMASDDYAAAAKSAEQALNNLPDGSNASVSPSQDGLVVRLQAQGASQPTTIPLNKAAADAFMNTGKGGQFDALLEGGVPAALQKLAGGNGTISGADTAKINSQIKAATGGGNKADEGQPNKDPGQVRIFSRSGVTNGWGPTDSGKGGKGNASGNGAAGIEREKLRQAGLDRRADMLDKRMTNRDTQRAASDQQKALAVAKRMEAQTSNVQLQERGRLARTAISNPNFLTQTDEQREAVYKKFGITPESLGIGQGGQQAPSQGGAPQQQAPAQPPVQGAKFYKGQWYTRGPNGESVPYQQ